MAIGKKRTTPVVESVTLTGDDLRLWQEHQRQSWYTDLSYRETIRLREEQIEEAKKSMEHDDGNVVYRSLKGMIEHSEYTLRHIKQAYDSLKAAGFKP